MIKIFGKGSEKKKESKQEASKNTLKYKYIHPDFTTGSVEVKEIQEDNDNMCVSLGITDERKEELAKIIAPIFKDHNRTTEAIAKASVHCKHPNELAFCVVVIMSLRDRQQDPFSAMLFEISRRHRENPGA